MCCAVRTLVIITVSLGFISLVCGCSRTPGIDQPISIDGGMTIQCTSAKRVDFIPGYKVKMEEPSSAGIDPTKSFDFIEVKAQVHGSNAELERFDAMSMRLNDTLNDNGEPIKSTKDVVEDPRDKARSVELNLFYIILADRRGPFNLRLPNGQSLPLDRLLKESEHR